MKLYLAGPMRGYADFNFPAFHAAANKLRCMGHEVFSPAEKDIEQHGADTFKSKDGDQEALASNTGFSLREALRMDTDWICREANGIALLKGWELSKGAVAESALANALGLSRYIEAEGIWLEIDANGRVTGKSLK